MSYISIIVIYTCLLHYQQSEVTLTSFNLKAKDKLDGFVI